VGERDGGAAEEWRSGTVKEVEVKEVKEVELTRRANNLYTSALPKGSLKRSSSRGNNNKILSRRENDP
jgi:hypothetical protein